MKHWEQMFLTYVYNHCSICNIPIYFYNIHMKPLQHISKTYAPATCAFSANVMSPCCLDEWSSSLRSLTLAQSSMPWSARRSPVRNLSTTRDHSSGRGRWMERSHDRRRKYEPEVRGSGKAAAGEQRGQNLSTASGDAQHRARASDMGEWMKMSHEIWMGSHASDAGEWMRMSHVRMGSHGTDGRSISLSISKSSLLFLYFLSLLYICIENPILSSYSSHDLPSPNQPIGYMCVSFHVIGSNFLSTERL